MDHKNCHSGMQVLYSPSVGGPEFEGIVRRKPFLVGDIWCTHLFNMNKAYIDWRGQSYVHAASLAHLRARTPDGGR